MERLLSSHELVLLYWNIGRGIVEKQRTFGQGEVVVEMVATDLRRAFPTLSGFFSALGCSPNALRHFDDEIHLAPLLVLGHQVALRH